LDEDAQAQRRSRGQSEMPPVAVVSRSLDLDWSSSVFAAAPEHARTIVITCAKADPELLAAAEQAATIIIAGEDRVEPAKALQARPGSGSPWGPWEGGPPGPADLVAPARLTNCACRSLR